MKILVELFAFVVQRIRVMRDDGTVRCRLVGEDDGAVFGLEFRNGIPILIKQHKLKPAGVVIHIGRTRNGAGVGHAGFAFPRLESVLFHLTLKAGDIFRKGRGVVGAIDGDGDFLLNGLAAFDLHLHLESFGHGVALVHGLDELRAVFGQRVGVAAVGVDLEFTERVVKRLPFRVRGIDGLPGIRPRQLAADILGIDPVRERELPGDGRITTVIVFLWRRNNTVVFVDHRVAEVDGRLIRSSGNVVDQLAGTVSAKRVSDADDEFFLSQGGFGEFLAIIQGLQQIGLSDLVGVAAILIELEDAVFAFDDLHQLAAALDAVGEVVRVVARVGVVGVQIAVNGMVAAFHQCAFAGLLRHDFGNSISIFIGDGVPIFIGDDFGDDVPVFVCEDGPIIGALHVDVYILRGDEVRVVWIDGERAVRVGAVVHEGFVGGIVDADLEVVEQFFTLARVEGVEVFGLLRALFRQDEGIDLGHAALGDDFGVQGSIFGVQVARIELAVYDEPGDQRSRTFSRIDLFDLE